MSKTFCIVITTLDRGLDQLSRGFDWRFRPTVVGERGISRHFLRVGRQMNLEANRLLRQQEEELSHA